MNYLDHLIDDAQIALAETGVIPLHIGARLLEAGIDPDSIEPIYEESN